MSDKKEVKLVVPKSLMAVLWLIAVGLLVNALPFDPIERAWASYDRGKYAFQPVFVKLVE